MGKAARKAMHKARKVAEKNCKKVSAQISNETGNRRVPDRDGRLLKAVEEAAHTESVVVRRVRIDPAKTEKAKKKKRQISVITGSDLPSPESSVAEGTHDVPIAVLVHVKPLLVLDLNGFLCRRIRYDQVQHQSTNSALSSDAFRQTVGHVAGTPVVARTDMTEFLTLLDANFTLAVWTSAKVKTAKALVEMLFPSDIADRLLFVWGQNRCTAKQIIARACEANRGEGSDLISDSGNNARPSSVPDKKTNVVFVKSLSKVWARYHLWNESNSILVDDSPEKAPKKYSRNALHPPPMLGTLKEETFDQANQEKQANFFRCLAEFWRKGSREQDSDCRAQCSIGCKNENARDLCSFLEEHGSLHMGWRGKNN